MLKSTKQTTHCSWGTLGALIPYSLLLSFVLGFFVGCHVLWQRQTSSSVSRLEWPHFKMGGEKFERVHKGATKIMKNLECNNPKESLWCLFCSCWTCCSAVRCPIWLSDLPYPMKSQNHRVIQVARYLRTCLVQPPAHSRVSLRSD